MKTERPPRAVAFNTVVALLVALGSALPGAQAQTFKVLYSFTGGADGGNPEAGVVFDKAGNLYGTTSQGGDRGCFGNTCGAAFELSPGSGGWSDATLHTFTGGSDGGNPFDTLTFDSAGNLYGTTVAGGAGNCSPYGCGVAFELTLSSGGWNENVLYGFGPDVGNPSANLTFDKHGHLYSTLPANQVYELIKRAAGWKEKTLYTFVCSGNNRTGSEPAGAPILDAAGNLYGTTSACGHVADGGLVYELLRGSWKEKTLHEFTGLDGYTPYAGLVFDKAGNLYGTTRLGGKYFLGTVFKLVPAAGGKWKETVLHNFQGGSDGNQPFSGLVFDKTGTLYGTTLEGGGGCGGSGCGTVFKLAPSPGGRWKEKVLYAFKDGNDGRGPGYGTLALDTAGNLYGTASIGGNAGCQDNLGCGVVFEIIP